MKRLNILQFICPAGFYGAEMWILALAKYLDRQKVNCQLVITHESEKQNREIYDRFVALGLEAHQIAMTSRFDPSVLISLQSLIKEHQINIIHTHGYKSDILGLIAARLTGIKALATPHGFENAPDFKLQMFMRMGCLALKHCDRVAPLSEELASDIRKLGVKSNKTRLILNGVDLEEIELEKQRKSIPFFSNGKEKRIVYVGQIAHRKNVGDLIKAFDLLYEDHKDTRLVLIGDGPERQTLERLAKSLPSADHIDFMGYRRDRLSLLKEMHLFSMTSSLEGIPRCMMESMVMEVPVAAYNIPGVDKLVIPGKTGLLAKFGDQFELKQCWEKMLFDGTFSSQVARNARSYVVEKFSARRMAEEYIELYQEMITEAVHSS